MGSLGSALESHKVSADHDGRYFTKQQLYPKAVCKLRRAVAVNSVPEALLRSASDGEPARVLICGSLYLAGHVLRLHA